ncbi:MAG TPA: sigma-70 family RNA polymerase sigma factor [Longimicrobiales bacterium]|nr:sigma-70 family RNA polymerase sigma factor [Longimicrobiales bacterium]
MTDYPPSAGSVTRLLHAARHGDAQALDDLFHLVYEELRSLARGQRRRWQGDLTMNATAIVHEAYIRLVRHPAAVPESRAHFFAVAAKAMRDILCNYSRDRRSLKRGGGAQHVLLDEALEGSPFEVPPAMMEELSALDDALRRLERVDPRQSRVVECRFFGGMSVSDTAAALGISEATVKRDWTMARAWLYREIREVGAEPPP